MTDSNYTTKATDELRNALRRHHERIQALRRIGTVVLLLILLALTVLVSWAAVEWLWTIL